MAAVASPRLWDSGWPGSRGSDLQGGGKQSAPKGEEGGQGVRITIAVCFPFHVVPPLDFSIAAESPFSSSKLSAKELLSKLMLTTY